MLLKDYLEQGLSITALANRFNISRGTIHNWITSGRLDQDLELGSRGYSPRPLVPHKLDPYKAIIRARFEEYPKLTAQRLFEEVRAAGYAGCYSRVRDFVRAVRPDEPTDLVVRFETPAGPPRASGLCHFYTALGSPLCPLGRTGLLTPFVAAFLSAPDHGSAYVWFA